MVGIPTSVSSAFQRGVRDEIRRWAMTNETRSRFDASDSDRYTPRKALQLGSLLFDSPVSRSAQAWMGWSYGLWERGNQVSLQHAFPPPLHLTCYFDL